MTGSKRCERDAPSEQLWLVEPLVGETADLGHEPTATFNRVPREENPPRIVARPDRRAANGNREPGDPAGKHEDTSAPARIESAGRRCHAHASFRKYRLRHASNMTNPHKTSGWSQRRSEGRPPFSPRQFIVDSSPLVQPTRETQI